MLRRIAPILGAVTVMAAYAGLYLVGWSLVWDVPTADRDGMEWGLLFVLTLPWSLYAGALGAVVLHAGAVVNATLLAIVAGRRIALSGRSAPLSGVERPKSEGA